MSSEDNTEDIGADQAESRWFIDLDWYQPNNRSFSTLARACLCAECRKQLMPEEREISPAKLLNTINDCCSKTPDFITGTRPILESIFRLFLAKGNQPLDLEELAQQLNERCGIGAYRASTGVLSRLLESDQYYGLRRVEE